MVRFMWCVEHCTEAGWELCAAEVPRSFGGVVSDMGLCLTCAEQFMRPVLSLSSQPEKTRRLLGSGTCE